MAILDSLLGWLKGLFTPMPSPLPVPVPVPVPAPPLPAPPPDNWQTIMLILDNKTRRGDFVSSLELDSVLTQAAQEHAEWMAKSGTLSHNEGLDGPFARLNRLGYIYQQAGENIAWGYADVLSVHAGWMSDAPHRANIVNKVYSKAGYGHFGSYWCSIYAQPVSKSRAFSRVVLVLPAGISGGDAR